MRTLTYFVATSADGFIAEADGSYDRFPITGSHINAMCAELPETLPGAARDHFGLTGAGRFDTVLEGRATHQVGLDAGVPDAYPHLRHLVFSSTLESVDHAIELVGSDPLSRVRELKAEDGMGIWLCGGGRLATTLLSEIDEFVLKVNPLLMGHGIPLLAERAEVDLELVTTIRQRRRLEHVPPAPRSIAGPAPGANSAEPRQTEIVQTFLPYPDFARSACTLDDKRLGKQRVEALQVVRALTVPGYGWANHPAVLMWKGF